MIRRAYDALLVDLDGTLVDDGDRIRPRNAEALRDAAARGVNVMIVTGRSEGGVHSIVDSLGLDVPVVVFNGAAIWCPRERRFLEERLMADESVAACLAFARETGVLPVVNRRGERLHPAPRTEALADAIERLEDRCFSEATNLPTEYVVRVTLLSDQHEDSALLEREVDAALERPAYLTHFPLNVLADHRESDVQVVDVQPPCRGKAEALRYLFEQHAIPPERIVAVGDATNDIPMMEAAGLGVAMRNSMPQALAAADRVIGANTTDAIAELVEELFPT